MGCTLQANKACTCPALSLKKEPGVSNRDLSGLMNGEAYTSEARSWSNIPPYVLWMVAGRQDVEAVFAPREKGRLSVIRELMSGGLISYQGNQ